MQLLCECHYRSESFFNRCIFLKHLTMIFFLIFASSPEEALESSKNQLCQYSSKTIFVNIISTRLWDGKKKFECQMYVCVCVRLSPAVSLQTLDIIQFSNAHFFVFWWGLCASKKFWANLPFWAFLGHFSDFHFFLIFNFFSSNI